MTKKLKAFMSIDSTSILDYGRSFLDSGTRYTINGYMKLTSTISVFMVTNCVYVQDNTMIVVDTIS